MIARIAVAVCVACLAACGSTGSNTNEPAPSPTAVTLVAAQNTGTLGANLGAGNPVSGNIIAGTSNIRAGQFAFSAQDAACTLQNLAILVPTTAASSVTEVSVSYKDANGAMQVQTQVLAVSLGNPYAVAAFTGLAMYVPRNDSATLDVFVGTPTIASGVTSGAAITVTLDAGATGAFRAVDAAGNVITEINAGVDVASTSTFYVRKSIPTFAMLPTGMSVPTTGAPLYRFSITADPSGAIEWSRVAFDMTISGMSIANLYLVEESTGLHVSDGFGAVTSTADTVFNLSSNTVQPKYQHVAAGTTKTYALYGTVFGFTTGSSIAISLAVDASPAANALAASVAGNFVWSDRSGPIHSLVSDDWTNGYLLTDLSETTTYSK